MLTGTDGLPDDDAIAALLPEQAVQFGSQAIIGAESKPDGGLEFRSVASDQRGANLAQCRRRNSR